LIIDAILLQDELALLEIRLNELGSLIDQFVLIEMPYDIFGKDKPYISNKPKFKFIVEPYRNKVKVVRVTKAPSGIGIGMAASRLKIAIKTALGLSTGSDILMFSETWRIPKAKCVQEAIHYADSTHSLGCNPFWWSFWGQGSSQVDLLKDGSVRTVDAGGGVLIGAAELAQGWGWENRQHFPCICDAGWALRGFRAPQDAHLEFCSGSDRELWGFPAYQTRECISQRKDAFNNPIQWIIPEESELPWYAWSNKETHLKSFFMNYQSHIDSLIKASICTRDLKS